MLHDLPRDKEKIKAEVTARITESILAEEENNLLELVNAVFYHERERLKRYGSHYKSSRQDRRFYREAAFGFTSRSQSDLCDLLQRMVRYYLDEIVGTFDPRMYRIATALLPRALSIMLNTMSPSRLLHHLPHLPSITESIILSGCTDKLKRLKDQGHMLIYVPEHISNLDSPVLGYSLFAAGLPPVLYGAGLNLFQLPWFSFFMDRLGAYKVDRLKQSPLYKSILKEFATVTLEFGYDHLFFPGGTRSRSGAIENRLKKGLLGTVIKSFISARLRHRSKRFFIVPVTVSYHLILEAASLIRQHLLQTGKSRYVFMEDESTRPFVMFGFGKRLMSLEGRVHVRFCEPVDPFGNRVDDHGQSLDPHGRRIDLDGYITRHGSIRFDEQRDSVYTNELADRVIESFRSNTVLLSTHIVAHLVFRMLFHRSGSRDLFMFLREQAYRYSIPLAIAEARLAGLMDRLRTCEQEGKLVLEESLRTVAPSQIIMLALKYFSVYHKKRVLYRDADRLFTEDANLLYYYHNRLSDHHLEIPL